MQVEGDAHCWHLSSSHLLCKPVAVRTSMWGSSALAFALPPASVWSRDLGKLPGDVKLLHGKIEQVPPVDTVVPSRGRVWSEGEADEHGV